MLYSYKHGFSGFSAKLNSTQATTLASKELIFPHCYNKLW